MEFGGIAQLGERLPCKQEVNGSIPFVSTILHSITQFHLVPIEQCQILSVAIDSENVIKYFLLLMQ